MGSHKKQHQHHNIWYCIAATMNACLSFFFLTYNFLTSGGLYNYYQNYIFPHEKPAIITLIISSSMITALIGAMIAGLICLKIGRRKAMMIFDMVGAIGVILCLIADLNCMFAGRLLIGLMIGVSSIAAPLYIAEIVPVPFRSHFANVPGVFSATGFLFSALGNMLIPAELAPGEKDNTWRVLISFSILLPVIRTFNFFVFFKDETPYFYVHNKKYKKAAKEIKKVSSGSVAERMTEMLHEENYIHKKKGPLPLSAIFSKRFRLAVLVCSVLLCLQQTCGNSIILVFIGRIYKRGWVGSQKRIGTVLGISTALVNLIASLVTIYTTTKFGRRRLLILGILSCGTIELIYGIIAATVGDDSLIGKVFLVFRPIFVNLSLGSVLNMTVAETLPDFGFSIASLINWTLGFLTLQFFPDATEDLGFGWTFIMYGLLTIAGGVFLFFTLVDSKNKPKDEVLKLYSGIEEPAKKDVKAIEASHKEAQAHVSSVMQKKKSRDQTTDQEGKALKTQTQTQTGEDIPGPEIKSLETAPENIIVHVSN